MHPVTLDELRQHLHELVDRFCEAGAMERAAVLATLRRRERLYLQLKEYLEAGCASPQAAPFLPVEMIPEPEEPAMEGTFIRLLRGGKLAHGTGEHLLSEGEVISRGLQHGDIVRAIPSATDARYEYQLCRPGPIVDPHAVNELGYPESVDGELVLVRTQQGEEVLLSLADMQGHGATLDHVLTVAFLREATYRGRYVGRIAKVHATPGAPSAVQHQPGKRRPQEPAASTSAEDAAQARPRFQPISGKQPTIVLIGGHPQSRAKFEAILADYGATLRALPYSPKVRQVRTAVSSSDIVIAFPSCCRTGHWKASLETARNTKGLFIYGKSENECGLRQQLETEVIPQWNSLVEKVHSA